MTRPNDLGPAGWSRLFLACGERADEVQPGLANELAGELAALEKAWPHGLPSGVIHADLFPDNVFFRDRELGTSKMSWQITAEAAWLVPQLRRGAAHLRHPAASPQARPSSGRIDTR